MFSCGRLSAETIIMMFKKMVIIVKKNPILKNLQQENEHFAQAWLRSAYEVLPANDNSACDANDMYRQYVACCTKLSRKGVIAPAHFPRLVRLVYTFILIL